MHKKGEEVNGSLKISHEPIQLTMRSTLTIWLDAPRSRQHAVIFSEERKNRKNDHAVHCRETQLTNLEDSFFPSFHLSFLFL